MNVDTQIMDNSLKAHFKRKFQSSEALNYVNNVFVFVCVYYIL